MTHGRRVRRLGHGEVDGDVRVKSGRVLLYAVNATVMLGSWAFDMNKTHMYNPNWPPHAKFHDAMTITLGTLAGFGGLYFLCREPLKPRTNIAFTAALPSSFFFAQLSAFAFPNTGGLDVEFPDVFPRIAGRPLNEKSVSIAALGLAAAGYYLATRSGRQGKRAK